MACLPLLFYPDPRLRRVAQPVDVFDTKLAQLIDDMFETMYTDQGVGLAATQVNHLWRVVVIDPMENNSHQPFYLVNPEIIQRQGEMLSPEGCLSVPGAYDQVKRAQKIIVRAVDKAGQPFELEAQDFRAAIIQHELDHLNGTLFIDHLSALKRERVKKHLLKRQREKK